MIHINRYIFDEGIGLRQIVDYYYILIRFDLTLRKRAMLELSRLGLSSFVEAIMYVLQEVFAIEEQFLLCRPNAKLGSRLLEDTMNEGNFGKYRVYANTLPNSQRFARGLKNM